MFGLIIKLEKSKRKSGRTVMAKNSLAVIEQGFYTNNKELKVSVQSAIKNCIANTKTYTPAEMQALKLEIEERDKALVETQIEVWQCNTIEALQRLEDEGLKVGILNFASAKKPGGGFFGWRICSGRVIGKVF